MEKKTGFARGGEVTRTGKCVEVPVGDTSLLCGEACHEKKEESVDRVQKMGYNERKRVNVLARLTALSRCPVDICLARTETKCRRRMMITCRFCT